MQAISFQRVNLAVILHIAQIAPKIAVATLCFDLRAQAAYKPSLGD
jgi:hypothetical protein